MTEIVVAVIGLVAAAVAAGQAARRGAREDNRVYWASLERELSDVRKRLDDSEREMHQTQEKLRKTQIEMTDLVAWVRTLLSRLPEDVDVPRVPQSVRHLIRVEGK